MKSSKLHIIPALLAMLLIAAACDLDSQTDSDYELLRGNWYVEHITADGDSQTGMLNSRYEGDVVLSFSEDGTTGDRFVSMYGNRQNAEDLDVQSSITLMSNNSLSMAVGSASSVIMSYDFEGSSRVTLTANPPHGLPLYDVLLGSSQYSNPVVQLTLERE